MDEKDRYIIDILLKDGREPASGISEKIGLSVPTVIDRMKKLQDLDIITGFKAKVNYAKLGLDVSALITIVSESSEHYFDVIEKANEIGSHSLSGAIVDPKSLIELFPDLDINLLFCKFIITAPTGTSQRFSANIASFNANCIHL